MLTNHPDERALLNGVLAAPHDDAPRLILADFYDEQGYAERAEFIRLQCEISRLCMGNDQLPMGVGRELLWEREQTLWGSWPDKNDVRSQMHDELKRLDLGSCFMLPGGMVHDLPSRDENPIFVVRRGFINEIRCTADAWEQYGDALLEEQPIELVKLTTPVVVSLKRMGEFNLQWKWNETPAQTLQKCWENKWTSRYPHLRFERSEECKVLYGDPNAPLPRGMVGHSPLQAATLYLNNSCEGIPASNVSITIEPLADESTAVTLERIRKNRFVPPNLR